MKMCGSRKYNNNNIHSSSTEDIGNAKEQSKIGLSRGMEWGLITSPDPLQKRRSVRVVYGYFLQLHSNNIIVITL